MKKNQVFDAALLLTIALFWSGNLSAQWSQNNFSIWNANLNKNVGIGTTNPTAKLSLVGNNIPTLGLHNNTVDYARIRLSNANNGFWDVAGVIGTTDNNDRLNFFHNAAGNILSLTGSGNVGIGTVNPTVKLQVEGLLRVGPQSTMTEGGEIQLSGTGSNPMWNIDVFNDRFRIFSGSEKITILQNGNVGIGTTVPTYKLDINGTARCVVMLQTSDHRYKTNIQSLDSALEKILAMRGTTYDFTTDQIAKGFPADHQIGFIAQEMQKVMPELVKEDADGMLAINYVGVIPVLVEALKEQQEVIEEKQARIAVLEAQSSELQARMARIEAALGIPTDRQPPDGKISGVSAKISPNPSSGLLTIELQNTAAAKTLVVKILDAAGREVASRSVASGASSIQFDLRQSPVGIYVAQIMADGKMVSSSKVQLVK